MPPRQREGRPSFWERPSRALPDRKDFRHAGSRILAQQRQTRRRFYRLTAYRSLARQLELWCRAAPLQRQYLASFRSRLWDLLAEDYAATCPDASPFDVAIS